MGDIVKTLPQNIKRPPKLWLVSLALELEIAMKRNNFVANMVFKASLPLKYLVTTKENPKIIKAKGQPKELLKKLQELLKNSFRIVLAANLPEDPVVAHLEVAKEVVPLN